MTDRPRDRAGATGPQRRAAERWFLHRGLPAVLRPGALTYRFYSRAAPALAAFAVTMLTSVLVVALTGEHTIDIDGDPTRTEWFVLGLVLLVLPLAALVGWLVKQIATERSRVLASGAAIAGAVVGGVFGGPSPRVLADLIIVGVVIALILVFTVTGAGSILGWVANTTMANLAGIGTLIVRALPVVLLIVLVFFNTHLWLMASIVSRGRLWLALVFLCSIAAVFLVSKTLESVRPMLSSRNPLPDDDARLAGTPFAAMVDRPVNPELSRYERANVVFVLAVSQIVQVLTVALVTAAIFFILGLILVTPPLLALWTRNTGTGDGQILGMTFPVPEALIQINMFLAALTFMYISARAVTDDDYRTRFLDPLIDDLRLTLVARNRYRTHTAAR